MGHVEQVQGGQDHASHNTLHVRTECLPIFPCNPEKAYQSHGCIINADIV